MNIKDVLSSAGLGYLVSHIEECDESIANSDIEIHYQESHPLLAGVSNIAVVNRSELDEDADSASDEKVFVIATYQKQNYGSSKAWEV
jgi:hypothetical protein